MYGHGPGVAIGKVMWVPFYRLDWLILFIMRNTAQVSDIVVTDEEAAEKDVKHPPKVRFSDSQKPQIMSRN